jgi:CO/xanthine dehydrogenase Mo-binding subunit
MDGAIGMKAQLEKLAADILGWPRSETSLQDDQFVLTGERGLTASRGQPGPGARGGNQGSAPLKAVGPADPQMAAGTARFDDLADRMLQAGGAEATGAYDSSEIGPGDGSERAYCAYMVEVEVDPETGQVRPVDVVQVIETGTVINPVAHQGQLDGGFVFGLGNALMEEIFIEDGKVATLHLGEYKLPTMADVPPLRTILHVSPTGWGPFGAKPAGELANNPVAPAIANAIADAVGARVRTIPLTAERVLDALQV